LKGISDTRYPLREEVRDYQLAITFGWTKDQIDAQPAVWLDWMLAIHGKAKEVEANAYHN